MSIGPRAPSEGAHTGRGAEPALTWHRLEQNRLLPMKPVALVSILLVALGIAGVAFVLAPTMSKPQFPSTLGLAPEEATNIARATTSVGSAGVDSQPPRSGQAPDSARQASPEVTTVPESAPPTLVPPPPPPQVQAKPKVDTATDVRKLSESLCGGSRPIRSITVLPDGTVQVQC